VIMTIVARKHRVVGAIFQEVLKPQLEWLRAPTKVGTYMRVHREKVRRRSNAHNDASAVDC